MLFLCLFLFTEITCDRTSLQLTRNVNVANDTHIYSFNEAVTMSCNYGFSGQNVTTRCTDLNIWSEKIPNCTSKIFRLIIGNSVASSNVRVDVRLGT